MNKRLEKVSNVAGVFQILIYNETEKKWLPPEKGALYRVFYYETGENKKRKKVGKYFHSLAEAKVFKTRIEKSKINSDHEVLVKPVERKSTSDKMLFIDLIEKWKELWLPNKNLSTQIRYKSYLKHFKCFFEMSVEKIEPTMIDEWISKIKQPEYLAQCHSTRCDFKHEFSVLRVILNFYASRYNRNYRLPFLKDHKAMLVVKQKMKINKDLSIEEFQRFMVSLKEVCHEKDCEVIYYLSVMQYATYSRIQEAAALHFEDFNFERNEICMNKKVQWLRSKGYEDQIVDGAKASGGKIIKMPDLAKRIFKEWVLKSGIRTGLLYTMDGEMISYRQIEYRYTQALKRANLPFTATHILRHAALTEHYSSGKDILLTALVAGQKDIRSTMRYTKVRNERAIEVQNQLDEKLSVITLGESNLQEMH